METNPITDQYELFCIIVNHGLGSKVMKIAKQNGITGGTIFLGKGTVRNHLLELLDLNDSRKEIVMIAANSDLGYKALGEIDKKFHFEKPNHGIAFTISISGLVGLHNCKSYQNHESRGAKNIMYNAIFIISDKGNAEDIIDTAVSAGSKGGTIINARGTGVHEHSKLFSMEIEPEKEIVLILSEKNLTEKIVSAVREKHKIDEPGHGIIFVLDVNNAYGLY